MKLILGYFDAVFEHVLFFGLDVYVFGFGDYPVQVEDDGFYQETNDLNRCFRCLLFKNPGGSVQNVSDGELLRAKFFAFPASGTSFRLAFRGDVFPIFFLYRVVHVFHIVLIVKRYDLRYVDTFRAGHTVPAARASYETKLRVFFGDFVDEPSLVRGQHSRA